MKKFLLTAAALTAAVTASASDAVKKEKKTIPETKTESPAPRVNVKLSATAVIGIINPAVEFRVFDRGTVQMEALGIFYPKGFLGTDRPLTLGASFFEFRYYVKKAFEGFFVGPNAGWGVYRLNKGLVPPYNGVYDGKYQVGSNVMLGATLGYTFRLTDHWGIELSFGGGWQLSKYEGFNNDGTRYVGWNGSGEWLPAYKGGIYISYRF